MSRKTAIQVPAGWYADPVEVAASGMATQRRWWDGSHWTHHVAALPTPVSPDVSSATFAAVTAATSAAVGSARTAPSTSIASSATVGLAPATVSPSDSARAAESMPLHSVVRRSGRSRTTPTTSTVAVPPTPDETVSYEPFHARNRLSAPVGAAASRASRNPLHLRVNTVSVWLIATMPLTQALMIVWVFSAIPADGAFWARALAVTFPFVLTAALAGQDTRLMMAEGHTRPAPWITALIAPPVYLAVRGIRVMRTTGAVPWPFVVWLVMQLTVLAVWFAIDPSALQFVADALS